MSSVRTNPDPRGPDSGDRCRPGQRERGCPHWDHSGCEGRADEGCPRQQFLRGVRGAWPDLAALTVAYDEAGSIRATWTFYEGLYAFQARCPNSSVHLDTGIRGLYFRLGGLDSTTAMADVDASYASWQGWKATLSYGEASVPASVSMSSDGQTLTVEAANPALGNRDYRKVVIDETVEPISSIRLSSLMLD